MQISLALSPTNPLITGGGVPFGTLSTKALLPLATKDGRFITKKVS